MIGEGGTGGKEVDLFFVEYNDERKAVKMYLITP